KYCGDVHAFSIDAGNLRRRIGALWLGAHRDELLFRIGHVWIDDFRLRLCQLFGCVYLSAVREELNHRRAIATTKRQLLGVGIAVVSDRPSVRIVKREAVLCEMFTAGLRRRAKGED